MAYSVYKSRICSESIDTIAIVLHSAVCLLTNDQLQKWYRTTVDTIRALSDSVDKDTSATKQFLQEEQLKKDIIESVCRLRQIPLSANF